jgi:hypothetical protein
VLHQVGGTDDNPEVVAELAKSHTLDDALHAILVALVTCGRPNANFALVWTPTSD